MTALVLATLLSASGLTDLEPVEPPRLLQRHELEALRPDIGGTWFLVSLGSLMATAGTGGVVFGAAMIITSSGSYLSGLAVALGVIFGGAGALLLAGGILFVVKAFQRFRESSRIDGEIHELDMNPMLTVARF